MESAIRNCDGFQIKTKDVDNILNWHQTQHSDIEIPFKPARVLLQDLTGVPVVVDFAVMRDAYKKLGGNPELVNPMCPTDLVSCMRVIQTVTVVFAGDRPLCSSGLFAHV